MDRDQWPHRGRQAGRYGQVGRWGSRKVDGVYRSKGSRRGWAWAANLPTCFWKTRDLHPEHGATGTRSSGAIRGTGEGLLASGTPSKLYSQALTLEVTAICGGVSEAVIEQPR